MIKKSIKELAWDVPEDTYRASPALSYSTLATFEREGAKCIPTLRDKKTSEPLRFGSLVDTLMTAPEEMEDKFYIAQISKPSEAIASIANLVWEQSDKSIKNLTQFPQETLLQAANVLSYGMFWKEATRLDKIIGEGSTYFKQLALAGNKMIVSDADYALAQSNIETLKIHKFTKDLFYDNPFEPDIEAHFQLKFKTSFDGLEVRCMFDRIIVDHNRKIIYPIDLKTTGKPEEHFDESFVTWSYWIQSNMYSQILEKLISEDEYFKDFTIYSFEFVCINRYNKSPLIWVDHNNLITGDRLDMNGIRHKHWKTLAKELKWHLDSGIYNYSYDSMMNNGVRVLNSIKIIQ